MVKTKSESHHKTRYITKYQYLDSPRNFRNSRFETNSNNYRVLSNLSNEIVEVFYYGKYKSFYKFPAVWFRPRF